MHNALGLSCWTVHEIRDTEIMREYHAACDAQPAACTKCGVVAHLYRHGSKTVRYVDAPSWGKQSLLAYRSRKRRHGARKKRLLSATWTGAATAT